MKIKVLRDSNNEVIATFPTEPSPGKLHVEPEVSEGQRVELLDVAENFASDLNAFYRDPCHKGS